MRISKSVQEQVDKRLTLNLLIQGAAAHTFITAHHLAKDELEEIRPGFTTLYDRFSIAGHLNYCIGDNALVMGWPNLLWGYSPFPQKPFRHSKFLSQHMNSLAAEETKHLKELAKEKGVTTKRLFHLMELISMMHEVIEAESSHHQQLVEMAKRIASEMWDIPMNRLDGAITRDVAFGNLQTPRTRIGRITRLAAIGYGGVELRDGRFHVVAKAIVLPLLIHELVKGILELICLHGLNELSEEEYQVVTDEADQLEYEAWLLQAGPAMWRRFLAVVPRETSLATSVMAVAKMAPSQVDAFMIEVIKQPTHATSILSHAISDLSSCE